jgi:hypothetical protein
MVTTQSVRVRRINAVKASVKKDKDFATRLAHFQFLNDTLEYFSKEEAKDKKDLKSL